MKKILLVALVLSSFKTIAQSEKIQSINRKVAAGFSEKNFNLNKSNDTVAFYAFSIKLDVIKTRDSSIVKKIMVNDSVGNMIFKDLTFLKRINFNAVLQNRTQATLIIPIGIVIAYVDKPKTSIPMLEAETIMPKVLKMFNSQPNKHISKYIYLEPVMCNCGSKTYD